MIQHTKQKGENITLHIITPEDHKRDTYYGDWTSKPRPQCTKSHLISTAELSRQGCRYVREVDRAIVHFYMLTNKRWEVIPLDKANDGWLKKTIRQLGGVLLDVQVELAPMVRRELTVLLSPIRA